ncbi:hypothetical protein COO60DRAFT_1503294 [Scenedesmus sp. NREL 46B-D3]|nr:hypothetical protein COO60DRAFT_1503294 [Scenedesmus sp. NREL 46B-D3]
MYCGCRTCCGKLTWCVTVLSLLCATIGLAVGLYFSVPCTRTLVNCANNSAQDQACWNNYWICTGSSRVRGVYFFLAVAGAACLLISLLSCCCFCCQKNPRKKAAKQNQFIAGSSGGAATTVHTNDTAPTGYSDQYVPGYQAYPAGNKPSVAHV